MTKDIKNDLHNADDALELERGFELSVVDVDANADAEGSGFDAPEKADEYFEDLYDDVLEQAALAAEAELEWAEKRKKNREKAQKQHRLAEKRALDQYAREALEQNDRAMRKSAEQSAQAEQSFAVDSEGAAGMVAKDVIGAVGTEERGYVQEAVPGSGSGVDLASGAAGLAEQIPESAFLQMPEFTPEIPVVIENHTSVWVESAVPTAGAENGVPFYENGGYPNAFSEAERLRKEEYERVRTEQEARIRAESEALIEKLNAEGAARQKASENYQSFGNEGIDYSSKGLHSAYVQAAAATGEAAIIDAGTYSTLRESYENSKTLFKSYEGSVPEAVVTQYQEAADRFFVVQRQIEQGALRIVEAPVSVVREQPAGASYRGDDGAHFQAETSGYGTLPKGNGLPVGVDGSYRVGAQPPYSDAGHVQPHSGAVAFSADFNYSKETGAQELGSKSFEGRSELNPFEQNMARYAAAVYASTHDASNHTGVDVFVQGNDVATSGAGGMPLFERGSFQAVAGASSAGGNVNGVGGSTHLRGQSEPQSVSDVSAGSPLMDRSVVRAISQERYDALVRKHAEAQGEVASYGDRRVPEDVQARYDRVSGLCAGIQQKIDNGSLHVFSAVAGSQIAGSSSFAPDRRVAGIAGQVGHAGAGAPINNGPVRYISQDRLDSLAKKHADAQKEVASYGDKEVPEAVRVKAEKVGKIYTGLQQKISSGAITVGSQPEMGRAGGNALPAAVQNRSRPSDGMPIRPIAQGTQAFFDTSRDNFEPGAKRIGNRHIKPPRTPFQGSPINKYDKLKIYHAHNYSRPFETATSRSLRALKDTLVYSAAQNEQTGAANMALTAAQRAHDVKNAVRTLVDTPRQVVVAGRAVADAGRAMRNTGRFLQGKDPLAAKERTPLTVRQLDKQYNGFFTTDERANFKKRFGDDVHLSAGQVRRKMVMQDEKIRVLDKEINAVRNQVVPMTAGEREQWGYLKKQKALKQGELQKLYGEKNALIAKNRDLKKEIKALQDKGAALTADERKQLKGLMKEKAGADKQLRKFSGKVETQKLKSKALKNEMRAVERKIGSVSSDVRKGTRGLMREKAAGSENMRRLQSLKSAQADAALRNKRADWVAERSGKKTIRKTKKANLNLNHRDKGVLERLKDRQGYSQKRGKLLRAKDARRRLVMSLGGILGMAARESEESSLRTLTTANRAVQNRYLRTVLKYSAKTALLPVVMAKKAAVGGYKIGRALDVRFNGGRIAAKIDGGKAAVHRAVRNAEAAATRAVTNSRVYKELHGGLYNRAKSKISSKVPERIKTRAKKVSDGLSGVNSKRKEILGKFNRLKEKIKQSKVGKAFSALNKGAKGVGKAFSFAKKALLKVGLAAGGLVLVICLIGAFITGAGGAAGTLMFGESSSDGRISLESYISVLNGEQAKINESVADYKSDTEDNGGAYKRVYVDYVGNAGSNNYKEIMSMAAVFFDQDLTNSHAVNNYIAQLFQASNYVTTSESAMYYCSGCEERSYHCYDEYDEYATAARIALHRASDHSDYALVGSGHEYGCQYTSYSCMERGHGTYNKHGCYQHYNGAAMALAKNCDNYTTKIALEFDSDGNPEFVTYYYCQGHCSGNHRDYYCPGHKENVCYGHIDLYVNVVCLGFDQIFAADPGVTVGGDLGDYAQGDLIGTFNITYYCAEKYPHICNAGPPYKTASGTVVTAGRTIAVDPSVIPLGTPVIINGHLYIAEDTGGAIKGNRIDIAVESHQEALNLGRDVFMVYSAAESDGEDAEATQRRVIDYKTLAGKLKREDLTSTAILKCFGKAKDPAIRWVEGFYNAGSDMFPDMRPYQTEDNFADSLQDFDLKHQSEPFTNAELNTFRYVEMPLDELKALVNERKLKSKYTTAFDIITEVLIPYDKAHPDVYVDPADDPNSEGDSGFYFPGWDADNKDWVKEIYANMNSENYSGLDQILGNSSSGSGAGSGDVSLEGLVIQGSKIAVTYYSQHDSRWANRPIRSDSPENTISKAGCGFTSMAIVVSSMTSNTIDPPGMCNKYGTTHYAIGQGAYHSLIPDVSADYGLSCTELRNSNLQGVIDALKQGKLVVALVGRGGYGWTGSGYYTGYGHFLVICGVTDDGAFLLADPDRADISASGKGVTIDYFVDSGVKKFWVIGK